MARNRHQTDNSLAGWMEMVGVSRNSRRCTLPENEPVYRI